MSQIVPPANGGFMTSARKKQLEEQQKRQEKAQSKLLAEELQKAQKQLQNQVQQGELAHAALTQYSIQPPLVQKQTNLQTIGSTIQPAIEPTIEWLQEQLLKKKQELLERATNMVLDADKYRLNIPSIKLMTEDKTPAERIEFIGNAAVATNVPIIIVASYIGELYGFTPELDTVVEKLKKFYVVKKVLNVRRPETKELSDDNPGIGPEDKRD